MGKIPNFYTGDAYLSEIFPVRDCMQQNSDILTVYDVATELHCSKTRVHKAIKALVAGV